MPFVSLALLWSLLSLGTLAQTWSVQNIYSGTACQTLVAVQYTFGAGGCSSIACTTSGSEQYCQSSVPAIPSTWISLSTFGATGCTGSLTNIVASGVSTCLPIVGGSQFWQLFCNGGTVTRTIFNDAGCSVTSSSIAFSGCTNGAGSSSTLAQCPSPSCTPPFVQTALNAAAIGTGTVGFITTATVTFCTSAVSQVFLSGDSTLNGGISIDDMLVYQLDANGVIGLGFAGTCSATGFLSIGAGSVTQAAVSSHGAPILLGTVSAGTHTLLIGTYNCGGGGFNSLINIVGCSLTSCTTTTTTTTATTTTATTTSSATTTPAVTGSSCFHESTLITYQGKEYSLQELQGNVAVAECRVPHVVRSSKGVIIETSCSKQGKEQLLHLTEDHLVLTSKGLLQASSLATGDILYADLEQTQSCHVTRVTMDTSEQTYFGLNCLDSVVLANGIKTSTFGKYHFIPATWMKWVSVAVGVDRASRWGDSLAELVAKMKVL
jgi:hypothetical protein